METCGPLKASVIVDKWRFLTLIKGIMNIFLDREEQILGVDVNLFLENTKALAV